MTQFPFHLFYISTLSPLKLSTLKKQGEDKYLDWSVILTSFENTGARE